MSAPTPHFGHFAFDPCLPVPPFGDAWEFENILKTLNSEKLIDIITYQTLLYNAMSKPELEHFKKIDFFNSQLSFFIDLCPLRATKL